MQKNTELLNTVEAASRVFNPGFQTFNPCQAIYKRRDANRAPSFPLYPLAKLDDLLFELKNTPSDIHDPDYKTKFSYLIGTDFNIWFSRYELISQHIPARSYEHRRAVIGECLVAGNIECSADFEQMIAIDHCNKAFLSDFDNIKLLFAIFVANEDKYRSIRFAETITLIECVPNSADEKLHFINTTEWKSWGNMVMESSFIETLKNQPTIIKTVPYHPPAQSRYHLFQAENTERLMVNTRVPFHP